MEGLSISGAPVAGGSPNEWLVRKLKESNDRKRRDWILTAPFVVVLPLALFVPESFIRFDALFYLVAMVEKIFPFISGYAHLSLFPQTTRLTLAVAMVQAVILLPAFLHYQLKIQDFRKLHASPWLKYWGWAAGSFALVPFFMAGPASGQSMRSLPLDLLVCQSRLALGGYAALLTIFEIIFLAVPVVWLKSKFLSSGRG